MKEFKLNNPIKTLLLTIVIIGFCIVQTSCSFEPKIQKYQCQGFYFDTIIDITIYTDKSSQEAETILSSCLDKCKYYDSIFSRTSSDSDIGRLNDSYPEECSINDETMELIRYAKSFSESCDGKVDLTVGALSKLWDFDSEGFTLPSDKDIKCALATVDYNSVIINPNENSVKINTPDTNVDLGFIAKGYIADKISLLLKENGISSAIINLGGNVLTIGCKPDGNKFKIGIKNPKDPSGDPLMAIEVENTSIVSSGNYERNYIENGKCYHHILDTNNGYPVQNNLSQVTIISQSSIEGDCLSTLCYILGYDESIKLLSKSYPDIQAVFVDQSGEILKYGF